ncbi:MAG: hypothetical protein NNA18_07650 [Nitrospira sp.]|nr:hypothetical protein [Nitrospira sp.]
MAEFNGLLILATLAVLQNHGIDNIAALDTSQGGELKFVAGIGEIHTDVIHQQPSASYAGG